MVLFVHIPKTAGTGFRKSLVTSCFTPEQCLFIVSQGWTEATTGLDITTNREGLPGAVELSLHSNIKLITGHFVANRMVKYVPNATLITWVRDPIQRLLSNYHFYMLMQKSDSLSEGKPHSVKRINNEDKLLLDYNLISLERYIKHPLTHNLMSRQINIPLQQFDFIGITEYFEKDLIRFEQVTGLQVTKSGKGLSENVNPNKKTPKEKYNVSDNIIDLIKKYNQKDFELYDKCLQLTGYK